MGSWRGMALVAGIIASLAIVPPASFARVDPGIDRDFSVIAKYKSNKVNEANTKNVIQDRLFRGGKKVGSSTTTCRIEEKETRCKFVFRLPGGKIFGFGDTGKGSGPASIVDGTGVYKNARGTMQGKLIRKQTLLVTFHIDKP